MYKITENDVRIFYELHSRFDLKSPYIAVIGNKERFERYTKEILKQFEGKRVRVLKSLDKLRILTHDGIETSFMRVETLEDLRGMYFRKFV